MLVRQRSGAPVDECAKFDALEELFHGVYRSYQGGHEAKYRRRKRVARGCPSIVRVRGVVKRSVGRVGEKVNEDHLGPDMRTVMSFYSCG